MNIPIDIARSQGHHGIRGAVYGSKGGRPRLQLTDEERAERKSRQRKESRERKRDKSNQLYHAIWGKAPGEPLTPVEFAEGQERWNAYVASQSAGKARQGQRKLSVGAPPVPASTSSPRSRQAPLAASVGQNSPCPCGSGRKFKHCCRS